MRDAVKNLKHFLLLLRVNSGATVRSIPWDGRLMSTNLESDIFACGINDACLILQTPSGASLVH